MGITVSPFANFFVRQDFEDAPDELDAADVAHANWNARVADNSGSADSAASSAPKAASSAAAPKAVASAASTDAANMSVSNAGLDLVKNKEHRELTAYQDGAGVPTIGYGHTGQVNGKPIIPGKTTITPAQADQLLQEDLAPAEAAVRRDVTVPITQGQFDALTDFAYNAGAGSLHHSALLRKLNRRD
ncbi:MAG: lysozyme [Burkholderiaceae bacterium]|jgi:lysozyme|nr:lysozyme [Burkholderiaceae bacterium]